MEDNQKNTQEEAGKTAKQFQAVVKKLVAILGSEKSLFPSKRLPSDELGDIVTALLQEEKEKNAKEVSEQLKSLLKGYSDLKTEVAKKAKELADLEEAKMKEFNKAAQSLFQRLEGIDQKEKTFYEGLKEATKSDNNPVAG